MQAVQAARTDDEVTAAVAANNWVAERAAEADDATPRRVFADLVKRLEPLLDRVCCRAIGRLCSKKPWHEGLHTKSPEALGQAHSLDHSVAAPRPALCPPGIRHITGQAVNLKLDLVRRRG